MKQVHYEVLCRLLYYISAKRGHLYTENTPSELAFIIGFKGACGSKEFYDKDAALWLIGRYK